MFFRKDLYLISVRRLNLFFFVTLVCNMCSVCDRFFMQLRMLFIEANLEKICLGHMVIQILHFQCDCGGKSFILYNKDFFNI